MKLRRVTDTLSTGLNRLPGFVDQFRNSSRAEDSALLPDLQPTMTPVISRVPIETAVDAPCYGIAEDRRMLRRVIAYCLIALTAFVIACAGWGLVIDRMHARPAVPVPFHSKIEAMFNSPQAARLDTVFVGSSRYFHGIDPIAFDLETARLGMPTHSYNLGFDALDFPELRFVVRHLLADPRSHFKNLFIEPSLRARLAPGLENSQRAITLHDAEGSLYIANFILRGNHDWRRKLYWLFGQSQVSLTRLSNIGALTNAFIRPQESPEVISDLVGKNGDGYVGLDPNIPLGPRVKVEGIRKLREDQTAEEKAGTARSLNDYEIGQLKDLQKLAADHGARLLLLAHPTATPETFGEFAAVSRAEREGRLDIPLTSFADPFTYFDLYHPAGFVDPDHINWTIVAEVSTRAADAFVAELKSAKKEDAGAVH
jgi:hypothetical protein